MPAALRTAKRPAAVRLSALIGYLKPMPVPSPSRGCFDLRERGKSISSPPELISVRMASACSQKRGQFVFQLLDLSVPLAILSGAAATMAG